MVSLASSFPLKAFDMGLSWIVSEMNGNGHEEIVEQCRWKISNVSKRYNSKAIQYSSSIDS